MYTYIHMNIYIYIYVCMYIYKYVNTCIYIYICYIHMHLCMRGAESNCLFPYMKTRPLGRQKLQALPNRLEGTYSEPQKVRSLGFGL